MYVCMYVCTIAGICMYIYLYNIVFIIALYNNCANANTIFYFVCISYNHFPFCFPLWTDGCSHSCQRCVMLVVVVPNVWLRQRWQRRRRHPLHGIYTIFMSTPTASHFSAPLRHGCNVSKASGVGWVERVSRVSQVG